MPNPDRVAASLGSGNPPFLTRRQLLAAAGAALACSALRLPPAWAQPADAAAIETFMALSQYLTGRPQLDPALGQRVLQALSQHDANFVKSMQALAQLLQQQPQLPPEKLSAALQAQQPTLAALPQQIVMAWYLGQVGQISPESSERRGQASKEPTPSGVTVIAYEHALMFDPVRDVLTVPSYCRDLPGYWAQQPT